MFDSRDFFTRYGMKQIFKEVTAKRLIWMFVGVAMIGVAVSLCRLSGFGTDPFSCMNLGVSAVIGMEYGTYQLLVNLVLLIPMLVCFRKSIGVGTIANMAGVGYIADFCMFLWDKAGITISSVEGLWLARIVFMAAAVVVLCLGVAFYMECNLGIAPYDALAQMIELWTKGKLKFSLARIGTDIFCVVIGFCFGSVVGIATVVTAFFTGPLVTFFRKKVAEPVLGQDTVTEGNNIDSP